VSRENVEIVRQAYEAFARRDAASAYNLYAADIELPAAPVDIGAVGRLPDQEPVRGRDAGRSWLANLLDAEEFDFDPDPEEFIDAGDAVVVPTRQTAVGKASGARVTNRLVYVYGFREGKVTYFDAFGTTEEALEAVGLRE
jgi:ketosteroid isomerase-like protein